MDYFAGTFDIAVVGAGHAGIEAALAAARLGLKTVCFTINLDAVGNMPCNPAIGGTGKGHLVRELDALGGEMGKAADLACIQYRVLNRGKGPAVHSLRAQADRREYQKIMKHTLESQENLWVKQGEVTALLTEEGRVTGVQTDTGAAYRAQAVVIDQKSLPALLPLLRALCDLGGHDLSRHPPRHRQSLVGAGGPGGGGAGGLVQRQPVPGGRVGLRGGFFGGTFAVTGDNDGRTYIPETHDL